MNKKTITIKGLVIAGDRQIYERWLNEFNKNPDEYQYVTNRHQIRGYYKLRSPDLEIILLHQCWKNPVYATDEFRSLEAEFEIQRVYEF